MMEKQSFDNFNDLRKESYQFIKDYREQFLKIILRKYGLILNDELSKRQKNELFESHKVIIYKDKKENCDKFFINGKLIGKWNRDIELSFKKGKLMCKLTYNIY